MPNKKKAHYQFDSGLSSASAAYLAPQPGLEPGTYGLTGTKKPIIYQQLSSPLLAKLRQVSSELSRLSPSKDQQSSVTTNTVLEFASTNALIECCDCVRQKLVRVVWQSKPFKGCYQLLFCHKDNPMLIQLRNLGCNLV